jgi:hypothetical protein
MGGFYMEVRFLGLGETSTPIVKLITHINYPILNLPNTIGISFKRFPICIVYLKPPSFVSVEDF